MAMVDVDAIAVYRQICSSSRLARSKGPTSFCSAFITWSGWILSM